MDLKSLDKEAEAAALKEIKNMFQRSGQVKEKQGILFSKL